MRARQGKRLQGAPRGGRWARRVTGRPDNTRRGYGWIVLLLVAVGLIGTALAFGWSLDRQLASGLLRQREAAVRRPDWVALRSLPSYIPQAFLAVVDPSFLERESLEEVEAETLSRELLRQVYFLEGNLTGESREMVMGPLLERRLSRRAVLELYLNRVFLGEQDGYPVYGVYHAAREYFDKEPGELTLGETATLAGLLLPPRIMDPGETPGAVGARRNEILRQLLASRAITPAAYQAAIREPLAFQPGLEHAPMTRPADWNAPRETIRVRANPPPADSAGA